MRRGSRRATGSPPIGPFTPSLFPDLVPSPPEDEATLLARADALAGRSLEGVAQQLGLRVPRDLKRHKGWVGQLAEHALGAEASSLDEPDFRRLGIELKTLPVDRWGRPVESTFVATVPLHQVGDTPWASSRVRRKLARVLWLPVQGERAQPLASRRFGHALLWTLEGELETALRQDWEDLSGMMGRGEIEGITGRHGRFLQVRPKAANARVRTRSTDAEGVMMETAPRGFYLRPRFTGGILARHFALPRR
ncbi:MAG: DNA mismatch repair endonuclease MutH [Myxococcota bacterium]